MRTPLLATTCLLALLGAAAPAAAQPDPGACVGSACPNGALLCVTGVDPRLDVCAFPSLECAAVVWLHEEVGPFAVWGSGCWVYATHEGEPVLP